MVELQIFTFLTRGVTVPLVRVVDAVRVSVTDAVACVAPAARLAELFTGTTALGNHEARRHRGKGACPRI